jgi:hypothetical protein
MREAFKDKQKGDPLYAYEINDLNRAARASAGESIEGFHGFWRGTPVRRQHRRALVELCSQQDAVYNKPYKCLLGRWNKATGLFCYPEDAPSVWAIDHRYGMPAYAAEGWKGLYQAMPVNMDVYEADDEEEENPIRIKALYVLVTLDCARSPEGCNECEES